MLFRNIGHRPPTRSISACGARARSLAHRSRRAQCATRLSRLSPVTAWRGRHPSSPAV